MDKKICFKEIGSSFINTSRGEAVCEESLVKA